MVTGVKRFSGSPPARAGKTSPYTMSHLNSQDHPRSCGKDDSAGDTLEKSGWITPARAGKTAIDTLGEDLIEDHPRSCGKDVGYTVRKAIESGSPPLVRERREVNNAIYAMKGITPARAGKTKPHDIRLAHYQDHPRSCGKDLVMSVAGGYFLGSPPLVRERLIR